MDKRLKHIQENFDQMKIGADEQFKFNCTMCGKCCWNREDILLNPKDVYNLAKELDMEPFEVIKKYCEVYIGHDSRVPIVRLVPVGPYKICPLLRGNRCTIHGAKPTVCATFPIGRAIQIPTDKAATEKFSTEDIQYILQPVTCGDKRKTHTVREWFAMFNIPLDDRFFVDWQTCICRISLAIRKAEEIFPESVMDQVFSHIYLMLYLSYKTDEDFKAQFDKNSTIAIEYIENMPSEFKKFCDQLNLSENKDDGGDGNA